jgi:hypothetical protein
MNNEQENKLSMYYSVVETNERHITTVESVPALKTAHINLKAKIASIKTMKEVQALVTGGVTEDKAFAKVYMVDMADIIIGAGSAFARVKNNNTLLENISFSRSDVLQGRDEDAYTKCMKVYNELNPFIGELADYGITPEKMAEFLVLINNYNSAVQTPRGAITTKKSATMQLVDLFVDADGILKIMDGLVKGFKTTNVDYYNQYFAAREIINLGVRHKKPEA